MWASEFPRQADRAESSIQFFAKQRRPRAAAFRLRTAESRLRTSDGFGTTGGVPLAAGPPVSRTIRTHWQTSCQWHPRGLTVGPGPPAVKPGGVPRAVM